MQILLGVPPPPPQPAEEETETALTTHTTQPEAVEDGGREEEYTTEAPPPRYTPTIAAAPKPHFAQRWSGNTPNVYWRAVPMAHLRKHPTFKALPHPSTVQPRTFADFALFRQDSEEWWDLHAGRCTTSALASCLGFYEKKAGALLGVPQSLRDHGKVLEVHRRMSAEPKTAELLTLWSSSSSSAGACGGGGGDGRAADPQVWYTAESGAASSKGSGGGSSSSAGTASEDEGQKKKKKEEGRFLATYAPHEAALQPTLRYAAPNSVGEVRMAWGNTQEATSVLAALNYFGGLGCEMSEAGMLPYEALDGASIEAAHAKWPALTPIGASPDAMLNWPDGTVEPFEVKNHAPFAHNKKNRKDDPNFRFRDPGANDGIAVWHVPQLYLHMLCVGPECKSCVFMSCSATRGANLFRIHRNEELMALMLHFLNLFCERYVHPAKRPPPNLFWGERKHRALLEKTIQEARRVEKIAFINPEDIQRGPEESYWL